MLFEQQSRGDAEKSNRETREMTRKGELPRHSLKKCGTLLYQAEFRTEFLNLTNSAFLFFASFRVFRG